MIERLLIANRGEIARRIMGTCRQMGVETVAVFSDADADSAFVTDADLAVPLGGNTPAESYLRIDALVDAATRTGADAVHPGYGFLAENAQFAQAVADAGLTFVGPTAEVIAIMGSKLEAKRRMAEAGVPLLGSVELTGLDDAALLEAGDSVGYPLLVKASAGGGGRGMRVVTAAEGLIEAATGAAREAQSAFGDGTVYAERYVAPSRHVEVQIFGDSTGTVVHFGERECSIQRRHQKIIEEAPSASINDATRAALHAAAVQAGQAIGYTNAGTVEFLLTPPAAEGSAEFFFLEVNTRLQVEHPVTEAVFGVDLVELQLEVASGGVVPPQEEIGPVKGHAVEARLYAEDPTHDFMPSTGEVHAFAVPSGVRSDSAFDQRGYVSQFYDPMIAKVIAHGPNRETASRRLAAALAGSTIAGIATNRELLVRTLRHPEFLGDQGDSEFLVRHDPAELGRPLIEGDLLDVYLLAGALAQQAANRSADRHTPTVSTGFRNVDTAPQTVNFAIGEMVHRVGYRFDRGRLSSATVDDRVLADPMAHAVAADGVDVAIDGVRRRLQVRLHHESISITGSLGGITVTIVPRFVEPGEQVAAGSTVASMPGTVVSVAVSEGDTVAPGDTLVVMEAMKMELTVTASVPGTVTTVTVEPGATVAAGDILVVIDDAP